MMYNMPPLVSKIASVSIDLCLNTHKENLAGHITNSGCWFPFGGSWMVSVWRSCQICYLLLAQIGMSSETQHVATDRAYVLVYIPVRKEDQKLFPLSWNG
jgi:hypothetical protein